MQLLGNYHGHVQSVNTCVGHFHDIHVHCCVMVGTYVGHVTM